MTRESQNNQSNQYVRDFSSSDERYLRQAIVLSQQAGARGNRPFGAVIADARGELVAQAENDTITAHDCTGHAETNALRIACGKLDRAALAGCTLYASGEPCVMCAGAIFWSNIRRVVYGADAVQLRGLRDVAAGQMDLVMSCREVFRASLHPISVIGPVLEEEALAPHRLAFDGKTG